MKDNYNSQRIQKSLSNVELDAIARSRSVDYDELDVIPENTKYKTPAVRKGRKLQPINQT